MNQKKKILWKALAITLCCAIVAFAIPLIGAGFFADNDRTVVIVLDPGHGGSDTGAISVDGSVYECDANLDIALACRDELMHYAGVEVYMTHTGLDYSQKLSLGERVDYANAVNADILISLHCNDASNPEANGSEVYVSHSTFSDRYNQDSTQLGIFMLRQFKELGMTIRGVKTRISETGDRIYSHSDGSQEIGDYYFVIGGSIEKYGIPGILVEHGFVTGDAAMLSSADGRRALGVADATAIAQFYGLKLSDGITQLPYEEPPEAVLVTDAEVISASDVVNSLIKLPESINTSHMDRLQDIRLAYEYLTPAARQLVDPELSEMMYRSILQLDSQMHPVRLMASESSEFAVGRIDHTITGLDVATPSLSGTNVSALRSSMQIFIDSAYIATDYDTSDCIISVVDRNGMPMDIGAQVGTECAVRLWKDDVLLDELYAVIHGDLSGDGCVTSLDQLMLEEHLYLEENPEAVLTVDDGEDEKKPLSEIQLIAADVNNDGRVNRADVEKLIYMIAEYN